ncbi:hypothetical protein BK126_08145 [Paenibacillus sp. FSL H7-0326]|uniref:DUF5381 family protein n=1 Tax=Paenibacillus sp. FSL H7-0326 TaxID=1921144 RepID=UPI00096DEA0F|nr:DUF5381 family protein [Paenibacillus sp. FSL H7-0326]OMC71983.1 hypothetical protein BK126_08145 [Paenibacillus sp. FSL H7-0326]
MIYVTYPRKTAILFTFAGLLFVLGGIYIVWSLIYRDNGVLTQLYYLSGAFLCFWFMGPLFYWNLLNSISRSTTLFSYNEEGIQLNNGKKITWSNIKKIEHIDGKMSRFILPVPSHFLLTTSHGEIKITTHNLLRTRESIVLKELRTTWNQNKNKT